MFMIPPCIMGRKPIKFTQKFDWFFKYEQDYANLSNFSIWLKGSSLNWHEKYMGRYFLSTFWNAFLRKWGS